MRVFVVGCGESGEGWFNHPHDVAIGCNDAEKFGEPFDYLVVCNSPKRFQKTPKRLETIVNSSPGKAFLTNNSNAWSKFVKNPTKINLVNFSGPAKKGRIHSSMTSPFIGMSYAWYLGATEIIIFGADFITHKQFNPQHKGTEWELQKYGQYAKILTEREGIPVYVSSQYSLLSKYIPVWSPAIAP